MTISNEQLGVAVTQYKPIGYNDESIILSNGSQEWELSKTWIVLDTVTFGGTLVQNRRNGQYGILYKEFVYSLDDWYAHITKLREAFD